MLGFLVAFSFNFLDSGLLGHWEVGVEGVWDGKESKRVLESRVTVKWRKYQE